MTVTFGKRQVGGGAPCFITFEAGPTHDGLDSAKQLVTLAAEAGGDAVKFQIFDPDRLVADRKMPFTYEVLVDPKPVAPNRSQSRFTIFWCVVHASTMNGARSSVIPTE